MRLEVAEQATPQFALETLRQVAQIYGVEDDDIRQELERMRIWEAYQTLAEADFARDGGTEALKEFLAEGLLLGEDLVFHRCIGLVAPDDRELAELFRDQGKAKFIWLPKGHADAAEVAGAVSLLLGLPRVSEAPRSITFGEIPANEECADIASRFQVIRRDLLGYIRKVARSRFDALVESGQAAALAWAPFRFADRLQVRYTLGASTITDTREKALAIDSDGIIVRADRCENLLDLGDDLEDTLGVQGLACAFHTLITVPPEQRDTHARRQGYLVPDEEWAVLCVSQALPLFVGEPQGTEDSPTDSAIAASSQNLAPRSGGSSHTSAIGAVAVPPDGEGRVDGTEDPAVVSPKQTGRSSRPRVWTPPVEGRKYAGPKRLRSPRASNARLAERLGTAPRRREVQEYLEGPEEPPAPVADPDQPPPNRIQTLLYAVNLEHGFLRFAPADLQLFANEWPEEIELIGDDEERVRVGVDYRAGLLHGRNLTAFLESRHDWPYGTILWLDATSVPGRYHLHAEPLEVPADIGSVEFFDFNDDGVPVVLTCRPKPFTVKFDANVYRQERRWENRRAYDALVAAKGTGVLTAVHEVLEESTAPATAAEVHRLLLQSGRPCSYFAVLAALYGYSCFEATEDHRWRLVPYESSELRRGYRALLETDSTPRPEPDTDEGWDPAQSSKGGLLEPDEVSRLTDMIDVLAQPVPDRWYGVLENLIEVLNEIRAELEDTDRAALSIEVL